MILLNLIHYTENNLAREGIIFVKRSKEHQNSSEKEVIAFLYTHKV